MRILRLFSTTSSLHLRYGCPFGEVVGSLVNYREPIKATGGFQLPREWSVPMVPNGTQRPTCRKSIMSKIMSRVIAIAACGLTLSACASSWMPSFDWSSSSSTPMELSIESDPPGADAKAASGPGCKTPCTLSLQTTGNFSVSISLNGYVPQTIPVKLIPPENLPGMEGSSQTARLDPNPMFVQLEPAPAPHQPAAKKKPPKKSSAKPAPTAEAAPQASSATFSSPPSQQPAAAGAAPWPMPR